MWIMWKLKFEYKFLSKYAFLHSWFLINFQDYWSWFWYLCCLHVVYWVRYWSVIAGKNSQDALAWNENVCYTAAFSNFSFSLKAFVTKGKCVTLGMSKMCHLGYVYCIWNSYSFSVKLVILNYQLQSIFYSSKPLSKTRP